MNLLSIFNDNDTLIDCAISIIQEANKQGFLGFSGYCGQAAILINDCLFNNEQQLFACFNQSLEKHNRHIGHIACLIDLPDGSYFILDSDAQLKSIDDIEHWGMLDHQDCDYQSLFEQYHIDPTIDNFSNVSQLVLTQDFIKQHFYCSDIDQQKKILSQAAISIVPLFLHQLCLSLKKKSLP